MADGKTHLKITPKSITIISKWQTNTDSGAYLTLLSNDELCTYYVCTSSNIIMRFFLQVISPERELSWAASPKAA